MAILDGLDMSGSFNIETILTKMDGKIDLIAATLENTKEDMRLVRSRQHEISNELQKLIALNIAGAIKRIEDTYNTLETRVVLLEHDFHQRKGAISAAKVLYGLGGTGIGAAVVTLIVKFGGM